MMLPNPTSALPATTPHTLKQLSGQIKPMALIRQKYTLNCNVSDKALMGPAVTKQFFYLEASRMEAFMSFLLEVATNGQIATNKKAIKCRQNKPDTPQL
jgi:hypothetical protein